MIFFIQWINILSSYWNAFWETVEFSETNYKQITGCKKGAMPSSDIHTNFITLKLKFAEQIFYLFRNDNSIAFNAIRNKLLDFFFLNECCRHLKFLFFISEKNHWRKCLQRHAIYKKWSISFNIFIHLQIYYLHRGDAHTLSVFKRQMHQACKKTQRFVNFKCVLFQQISRHIYQKKFTRIRKKTYTPRNQQDKCN